MRYKKYQFIFIIILFAVIGLGVFRFQLISNSDHHHCPSLLLLENACPDTRESNLLFLVNHHLQGFKDLNHITLPGSAAFLAAATILILTVLAKIIPKVLHPPYFFHSTAFYHTTHYDAISRQFIKLFDWITFHNKGSIAHLPGMR